jgi:hypothetical protein
MTSPEMLSEEDIVRSFPSTSQSTISKTIFLSHLPIAVNSRRLRTLFPGCRKIIFKKNYWNKNFRL